MFYPPRYTSTIIASKTTIQMARRHQPKTYAEFGVYRGSTAREVAKVLPEHATMLLFDHKGDRFDSVRNDIARARPDINLHCFASDPTKALDSYCWHLGNLLNKYTIDYAFFDGAQNWTFDGFAVLLVERMLADKAIVEFGNYFFSFEQSAAFQPAVFPAVTSMYTDCQRHDQQIKRVVSKLIRCNPRYREIIENRAFQWSKR